MRCEEIDYQILAHALTAGGTRRGEGSVLGVDN